MFFINTFLKIINFFLGKPFLIFIAITIALILRWYFWEGIFAAIFIGVIIIFIFLFIFAIYDDHTNKASEDEISETYIEYDKDGEKNIQSKISTSIVSRSDGNQTEHIILSKHTRLPQKITYE